VTDLAAIVGGQHVATDPDITAAHARDWTGRFVGTADVVVSPGPAEEVGAVAAACSAVGTPMVAQGGNTSLVAGGVPEAGQVVVDLRRLRQLAIDPVARVATADAGVTIAALQRAAAEHGLRYPVDLASRDTATVGGTIATNAGGLRVVRHGMTRAQLLGIAAVLADGSQVEHLPGFGRDNTGYHLPSLLCGSEGTLAFVTRAQLRLIPVLTDRVVALQRFPSLDEAVTAATALAADTRVEAVELMLRPGVELVCSVTGLAPPPAAAAYVLTESSSPDGLTDDALVALDPADAARLWAYRERHAEAIATRGPVHKLDVTLPQPRLAEFLTSIPGAVTSRYPGAEVWLFGHVGDGNVHVNVTGVDPADDDLTDLVLRAVAGRGGSISSEHGIGRAKARWLPLVRSPAELALFRRLKSAFDPDGLLNPGVLRA
jgi:FAD/FMN-containing dehydrogenase